MNHATATPGRVEPWRFRLYVAGATPASLAARTNLKLLCDAYLPGTSVVEIIDVHENPARAASDQIFAIPTLIRIEPSPTRRVIGTLSSLDKVLAGLEIPAAKEA